MVTELVVFDMDGTLADTAGGIIASFMAVAHELEVPEPSLESLSTNIGGSLVENMSCIFDLDPDEAVRASEIFKDHYGREGYLQAGLFPGMEETLMEIHRRGIALGIATLKLDEYAKRLVDHWGLADLFVDVCGADELGSLGKSDLIDRCIYAAGTVPDRTLMVGDTVNDLVGARESGTGFVAVTFGYGFTPEVCRRNGIAFTETPGGVLDHL